MTPQEFIETYTDYLDALWVTLTCERQPEIEAMLDRHHVCPGFGPHAAEIMAGVESCPVVAATAKHNIAVTMYDGGRYFLMVDDSSFGYLALPKAVVKSFFVTC